MALVQPGRRHSGRASAGAALHVLPRLLRPGLVRLRALRLPAVLEMPSVLRALRLPSLPLPPLVLLPPRLARAPPRAARLVARGLRRHARAHRGLRLPPHLQVRVRARVERQGEA